MRDIPKQWVELYLHDTTVHDVLQTYRLGRMTWAEAMEELALHQSERAMRAELEAERARKARG